MKLAEAKKPISIRAKEMKQSQNGFGQIYRCLIDEGYKPEEFLFHLSEYLVLS
ncbi:MAG TPA: hypothetical protein VFF14_05335 [Candidatus Deferrimicrobium sp.]|nr:hypothetical protein [Candidatus Deferrimicrobium sp.]